MQQQRVMMVVVVLVLLFLNGKLFICMKSICQLDVVGKFDADLNFQVHSTIHVVKDITPQISLLRYQTATE